MLQVWFNNKLWHEVSLDHAVIIDSNIIFIENKNNDVVYFFDGINNIAIQICYITE